MTRGSSGQKEGQGESELDGIMTAEELCENAHTHTHTLSLRENCIQDK